ncbi:L-cysteine S-thiosulfotransferase subunit SoxA [Myxococcaceae bacterium]|nr:L-cysteine S-thiosulfotransferase subunit SoxA [Myxococcaceae bacterium]
MNKALWAGLMLAILGSLAACQTGKDSAGPSPAPLALEGSAAPVPWKRYVVEPLGVRWPQTDWKSFNNLVQTASPPVGALPKIDGPIAGNAENGKKLVLDRSRGGGCITCHILGNTGSQPGNPGPDLSMIGAQRTPEWLFAQIWEPRLTNPQSFMPPWGTHGVFSVEEVRDMVAFLMTLKTPAEFKSDKENPNKRPAPVETRPNLDPTENPAAFIADKGAAAFRAAGPKGQACIDCHRDPAQAFAVWGAQMPSYEPRLDKVLGVEEFVTRHARATTGGEFPMQSETNLALAIYLRALANGQPIRVDTRSPGATAALARGQALMDKKVGQLNFSCRDCHDPERGGNHWFRGQYVSGLPNLLGHFPTWRTARGEVWDIRKRFQWCNVSVRANELPPDAREYGDIELALTTMNAGRKLSVPGIRH